MKKIRNLVMKACLISTFIGSANASIAKYKLAKIINNAYEVNLGFSKVGFRPAGLYRYPLSAPSKKSYRTGGVRASELKKYSGCKYSHKRGLKKYYRCIDIKSYKKDLAVYNKNMNIIESSSVVFDLKGFNKTMSRLYGEVVIKGPLAIQAGAKKEVLKQIVNIKIDRCLNEFGEWKSPNGRYDNELKGIERLLEGLFQSEGKVYQRCILEVAQSTFKIPGETSRSRIRASYNIEIDIDNEHRHIDVNGASYVKRKEKTGDYNRGELEDALEDYVDFIKFEYGSLLSEIAMNELPSAQAKLKIQRFLLKNRKNIEKKIKRVKRAQRKAPSIAKISTGFAISKLYAYVREIEKSMKTRMTLDNIVKTYH